MRIRQWVSVVVLFVCLAGQAAVAQKPVQYVVHGDQELIDTYRRIFDRFTEETGIPVEIIHTAGGQKDKWEQVITLVASGLSPDVVGGVSTEFGEFAINGLLRPLDDLILRSGVSLEDLVPPFVEALQFGGEQFLLPYGSSALAMFYNIHHFDQAGLAYPPKQWNTPEWTFDAFVDNAVKLTTRDADGSTSQYGVAGYYMDSWITLPYSWGGRWVSDDLRTFEGTSPQAVAALQSLQDLIHQYQVMPADVARTNFITGRGSMAGLGTWYLTALAENSSDWDFMPWFRVQESARAAIFPIGYGILSTSSNVEGAWELIRWLTWNEEENLQYATTAGAIPALLSNLPEWRSLWNERAGRTISLDIVIEQAALHGAIIQIRKSPAFWSINEIMNTVVSAVTSNQKSAQAALEEVADLIQMLLEETAP